MCEADRSPSEEVGKTRQGQKPGEDGASRRCLVDVGEAAEEERDDQNDPRSPTTVHFCSPLGSHALGAKSLNCSGRGECARVCDGDDGQSDDSVEDAGKDLDTGESEGQHKGRVRGVSSGCVGKTIIVGRNDETKDEQRDDVEQSDTPENLLGSFWDGLAGVSSFCSCETDQFSSPESE